MQLSQTLPLPGYYSKESSSWENLCISFFFLFLQSTLLNLPIDTEIKPYTTNQQ